MLNMIHWDADLKKEVSSNDDLDELRRRFLLEVRFSEIFVDLADS